MDLENLLGINRAIVAKKLHEMNKFQNLRKWISHKLPKHNITDSLNVRVSLLIRQYKNFL